jgi:hypothetical protein
MRQLSYCVDAAEQTDLAWVAATEARLFSPLDAIPEEQLDEWYQVNRNGFALVRNKKSKRIGHLVMLPLKPDPLRAFISGRIVEHDVTGPDLYTEDVRQIKSIYIESLALLGTRSERAVALRAILTNWQAIVSKLCDTSSLEDVYVIAASEAGRRFIPRLGFRVRTPAASRLDHHDLYSVSFQKLERVIASLRLTD